MSVRIKNVTVEFPGIKALDRVDLSFEIGRIYAVLGANGSGKSTLVKVLTGIYTPLPGAKIEVDGQVLSEIRNPGMAKAMGIRVVHQEAPLINSMSVAECIALFRGYPLNAVRCIRWKALYQDCKKLLTNLEIHTDPRTMVGDLSAAERAMIAIAIAMGDEDEIASTKLLILDEADASIPEDEAEVFLKHVKLIARRGVPVVMVTHRLKEARAVCDGVYILNNGRLTYSGTMSEIDDSFIIRNMLRAEQGSAVASTEDLQKLWRADQSVVKVERNAPALELKHFSNGKGLKDVSFVVEDGEIVGVVGIAESGIQELPTSLGGDVRQIDGEYIVGGQRLPQRLRPDITIRAGVCFVPADRFRQGGVMFRSMRDNMLMPDEKRYFLHENAAYADVEKAMDIFDVQPHISRMPFGKFSGGNQQKAIIAKWLMLRPKLLVLDDPTYGVDPASRLKIFDVLRNASSNGIGILVFSTEPEQLALLCSRVLIMKKGVVSHELCLRDGSLSRESIARWCYV